MNQQRKLFVESEGGFVLSRYVCRILLALRRRIVGKNAERLRGTRKVAMVPQNTIASGVTFF